MWSRRGYGFLKRMVERREEEVSRSSLLQVAGMFAIGDPGWTDHHDQYLTETFLESHTDSESDSRKA